MKNEQKKPTVSSPTSTALLCCPFCGGEANTHLNGLNLWKPYCTRCTVILNGESGGFYTKRDAVDAWNQRAINGR